MGRSPETLDMKFFVVIALAGAAVASPSNRNDDDGAAAALECTAGTNIGDKLANAFSSCFGSMAGMRKEVKRIQLTRNDDQCYVEDHECADTFSEEEANSLLDTAEKIAHYECFLHLFEQGCMDFLGSTAAGRR